MKDHGLTTSKNQVAYIKRKKPDKTPEERRRENNSLVIKNIYNGGGDGCA